MSQQLPPGVYYAPSKLCMICGVEAPCIDGVEQPHRCRIPDAAIPHTAAAPTPDPTAADFAAATAQAFGLDPAAARAYVNRAGDAYRREGQA